MIAFIDRLRRGASWGTLVAAALAAAAQLGCGGGVGTGGTGSFASGPITGFGSIIVGGVHYDESAARIESDDGSALPGGSLRLGMVVEVDAEAAADARAMASQVRVVSELVGRVDAVDLQASTLTVNGQLVRLPSTTVFDEAFALGLASVGVNSLVEVYGFADSAGGTVLATRVEPRAPGATFKFRGEVSMPDRNARTFAIGSQGFSYQALNPQPPAPKEGDLVRVEVAPVRDANGRWVVTSLCAGSVPRTDVDMARLEGVVGAMLGNAGVRVAGLNVNTVGATIIGGPLAPGRRVEAEGVLRGNVLFARQVSVRGDAGSGRVELHGTLSHLDRQALTFRVGGKHETVSYARPDLVFENGTVADLANGRRVGVQGMLARHGNRIEATRIVFD